MVVVVVDFLNLVVVFLDFVVDSLNFSMGFATAVADFSDLEAALNFGASSFFSHAISGAIQTFMSDSTIDFTVSDRFCRTIYHV